MKITRSVLAAAAVAALVIAPCSHARAADAVALPEVKAALSLAHFVPNAAEPLDDSLHVETSGPPSIDGYASAETAFEGTLANGVRVLLVPLFSGGSGGDFYTLLFTKRAGKLSYLGYLPAPGGHGDASIAGGLLRFVFPIYGPNDSNASPSRFHTIDYTIVGNRLKTVRETEKNAPR